MKNFTFVLLTFLIASLYSLPANAASFDCKKATTYVEELICLNPELSKLDEQLATHYKIEIQEAKDNGYSTTQVRAEQIRWLTFQRNTCMDESCLLREYKERLGCVGIGGNCGNDYGRSDIVDDKAFGTFTDTVKISIYNPTPNDKNHRDTQTVINKLHVLRVSDRPYLGVVDTTLVFDNGHQCSINDQLARWGQNHWVLNDTYNGETTELRLYPATKDGKTQMLIRDINGQYRKGNCGMRGYFDGLVFEK